MTKHAKIKIIKKKALKTKVKVKKVENESKQESARKMVRTVSNWVSDVRKRRQGETKVAIENLFCLPKAKGI